MATSQLIAHHLFSNGEQPATLALRDQVQEEGPYKESLLDKLKSSFMVRLTRRHGSFSAQEEPLLPAELDAYLAGEHSLTEVSQRFVQAFAKQLEQQSLALNAHFLFFTEKAFDHHHIFYLFVAHQSESLAISEQLEVCPSYVIDTGATLFGIKVDLAEWKGDRQYAYLSSVPPKGDASLVELFDLLTGFHHGINKQESTTQLLDGIEHYVKQLPNEQANEVRHQVVEYCTAKEKSDEPVTIPGLSEVLNGIDCDQFIRQMATHNPKAEDEPVMIDRRALQRYVKFSGREKALAISFSSDQLNERVIYDENRDTLTINGLPKALRDQLLRHLTGR
ncbi:MAG: nucleoid-associated protein [Gammaproteobacteria bacterium]|nr:nucleoid-associated protein [Gammaproteobacteria bacterium]MCF6230289.1 nucleoid-associated protein [Gammaproteobacteria bacterium]